MKPYQTGVVAAIWSVRVFGNILANAALELLSYTFDEILEQI
jgi:hypothetical protein